MMLIDASWPSKRLAAVTTRTGWCGRCSSAESMSAHYLTAQVTVDGPG
jgi:hypothetical protein